MNKATQLKIISSFPDGMSSIGSNDIIDVPFKELSKVIDKSYKALMELKDREVECGNQRFPRFRFMMFKGATPFTEIINVYKNSDYNVVNLKAYDDFQFIITFYALLFGGNEYKELCKLYTDESCWHLLFVGFSNSDSTNGIKQFRVLGAASFKILEQDTIIIKWFGVSKSNAHPKEWGRTKQQKEGFSNFDGKPFQCKGIGSTLLLCVQTFGSIINNKSIDRFVLESSNQALPFYKYGMGFVAMSNSMQEKLGPVFNNEIIGAYDLPKLVFMGSFTTLRPPKIPNVALSIVRDNVIRNIYCSNGSIVEIFAPSIFTASRTHEMIFYEKTIDKEIQKTVTCAVPTNSTLLQTSEMLLEKLVDFNKQIDALMYFPNKYIGLLVLRLLVYSHIASQAIDLDAGGYNLDSFFGEDVQQFEKERNLVATLAWYYSKMKSGIPDDQYKDSSLYQQVEANGGEETAWFSTSSLGRNPTDLESTFLKGNLVHHICSSSTELMDKILNKREDFTREAPQQCSPEMLHFLLQQVGLHTVEPDSYSNEPWFFSFISCVFKVNIILIKVVKRNRTKNKTNNTWDVVTTYCNNGPGKSTKARYKVNVILCGVHPEQSSDEIKWCVLLNQSFRNTKLERIATIVINQETQKATLSDEHESMNDTISTFTDVGLELNIVDEQIDDDYAAVLDSWIIRTLLMDNVPWPLSFLISYCNLLVKTNKISKETYLEVNLHETIKRHLQIIEDNKNQVQDTTQNDATQQLASKWSIYKLLAIIVLRNEHFTVCVIEKASKCVHWFDSDPKGISQLTSHIQNYLYYFDIEDDIKTWKLQNITRSRAIVLDSGPIALDDLEFALKIVSNTKLYRHPVERKIMLLTKYCEMYFSTKNETQLQNKYIANLKYIVRHLDAQGNYKFKTVCPICHKSFSSINEKLIIRNCTQFCMYHEQCFQDHFVTTENEQCIEELCKRRGCGSTYTKYNISTSAIFGDQEKGDTVLERNGIVQWKQFIEEFPPKKDKFDFLPMFTSEELEAANRFLDKETIKLAVRALDPRSSDDTFSDTKVGKFIHEYDILRLRPRAWLNDTLIYHIYRYFEGLNKNIRVVYRNTRFDHSKMDDTKFYMFVVNYDDQHWGLVECRVKSNQYYCYGFKNMHSDGYLEKVRDYVIKNLQLTIEIPDRDAFIDGEGYAEEQDGCNCGIILLRRIEVRALVLDGENFTKKQLALSDYESLGDYNVSRIKYAAIIAQQKIADAQSVTPIIPQPIIPFDSRGVGTASSPIKFNSTQQTTESETALRSEDVGTTATEFESTQKTTESESEAAPFSEEVGKPQQTTESEAALRSEDVGTATEFESTQQTTESEAALRSEEVGTRTATELESITQNTTESEVAESLTLLQDLPVGARHDEARITSRNYNPKAERQQQFQDEYDDDATDVEEDVATTATSQGRFPGRKTGNSIKSAVSRKTLPGKTLPVGNPKTRIKYSAAKVVPRKPPTRQLVTKGAQVTQNKRKKKNDNVLAAGTLIYPLEYADKIVRDNLHMYDKESLFNKIETTAENKRKFSDIVKDSKLTTINEANCMIENVRDEEYFIDNFDGGATGDKNSKKAFLDSDLDFDKVSNHYTKLYNQNKKTLWAKSYGSFAFSNEIFYHHPNSLMAIRYKRAQGEGDTPFEAITAPVFGDNNKESRIVRVSDNWAKANFDTTFVAHTIEMSVGKTEDYIQLKNCALNITKETENLALAETDHGTKKYFYQKNPSNDYGSGIMLIMRLKLKAFYDGDSRETTSEVWLIKSIERQTYLLAVGQNQTAKRIEEQLSPWLEISKDVLFHKGCVGEEVPLMLIREAFQQRQTYCDQTTNYEAQWTYETTEHRFENDDESKIPKYKQADKQISALRFDATKNQYYAQVLDGISKTGIRKYEYEIEVDTQWVEKEFSDTFISNLKERSTSNKYLWIPVGKASKRPFPYKYNNLHPKIKFQQGQRDSCASSSLASCFHYMGHEELAMWIEAFGKKFLGNGKTQNDVNTGKNQSNNFLSSLMFNLQKDRKDFNKMYGFKKIIANKFDIFSIDEKSRKYPKLLQLLGSDGGIAHAVTIYDGLIFDSNLFRAVVLNKQNLEFCMDAVYSSIFLGYEIIPQLILRNEACKSNHHIPSNRKK